MMNKAERRSDVRQRPGGAENRGRQTDPPAQGGPKGMGPWSRASSGDDGATARQARALAEGRTAVLGILGALSAELFAGSNVDSVLAELLARLAALLDAPYAALFENAQDVQWTLRACERQVWTSIPGSEHNGPGNRWQIAIEESQARLLAREEPVCAPPATLTRENGLRAIAAAASSLLFLPVMCGNQLWGLLCFAHERRPEEWNETEIAALATVAKAVGAALDVRDRTLTHRGAVSLKNMRLFDETQKRADELELLHQVAIATATLVDVDKLIEETTRFIAQRIYTDVFGFLLYDEDAGKFMPHPSYHGLPPGGATTEVPLDKSVSGNVVRTGQPMVVPDVTREPLYFPIVEETRSEISVPMVSGDDVIGVINVESRRRDAFSASDLRFLKTLAGQVVTAMERAQLYKNLEEHAYRLTEKVRERTIELEQERDRMLAILDNAGEGIVFTDVRGKILYVNPAMERQTGYSREECMGRTPRLWKSEETDPAVFEQMWNTVLDGERWQGELVNKRKNGSLFDAALTITPQYDHKGDISGFVSVQADISRIREVDRLKSKFIANVSHELRTPLTNIRNYLALLERGSQVHRDRYLAVIQHETRRLTRLIQDLLDLSVLDRREQQPERATVDVRLIMNRTIRAFAAEAERKEIALAEEAPEHLPPLTAAKSQIQQVLNNLLGNALAYTPAGGRVEVGAGMSYRGKRRMLWLRVSDDGPGIREDEMPHLFTRFFRGSAAERSDSPGTGLGLSICREILDNHGGYIDVDSAPGKGAIFTSWWPLPAE